MKSFTLWLRHPGAGNNWWQQELCSVSCNKSFWLSQRGVKDNKTGLPEKDKEKKRKKKL